MLTYSCTELLLDLAHVLVMHSKTTRDNELSCIHNKIPFITCESSVLSQLGLKTRVNVEQLVGELVWVAGLEVVEHSWQTSHMP